jgi:hypothetical protein
MIPRNKFKSQVCWGILELTRLAQTILLERLNLLALIWETPPDNPQSLLFNKRARQQ